jgi:two-component system, cell cycle sensor histidine kinase and response regulator CckA
VTEKKQLEVKVARADRLVALGTLAAGVAHEISNPLSYVMLSLEAILRELREGGPAAPTPREVLGELGRSALEGAQRVRVIVNNLKTLSRGDESAISPVDLRAVLEWSIGVADHQVRHCATIARDFRPDPLVAVNEARLGQVFVNLLINAAQAIGEAPRDRHEIRVVTSTDPAGDAVVEIRDTGRGIPPEVLGRIFDPFFTTKPVGVGTGIGLAICHNIVTGLGGDIEVESAPGAGATFRVRLPAHRGAHLVAAPRGQAPGREGVRRARILIVDDEIEVGRLLAHFLEAHDVSVVSRGRDAIERLEREAFDVVFCDVMMPDVGGIELHEALRRRRPGAERRIVFMTGGAFTAQARAFLDGVPNPCIDKPFDLDAIDRALRVLLADGSPVGVTADAGTPD